MANETATEARADPTSVLLPDVIVRCSQCGYVGPAEPKAPGKMWLEAVFWVAFMVPGVCYSIWRLFWRKYLCPQCKAADEPVDIPASRWAAMVFRAVLLVGFVTSVLGLLLLWNYPGVGGG